MITLFPGSFNPIHLGHIRLAEYMLTQPDVEEVWFLVSPNNPLKAANTLWDEQIRLRLVQAAIQGKERISASDFEFALPRPSYTANTLRALAEAYPNKQFALLIGEDNMQVFDKWREHEWIMAHYPIFVYPRSGCQTSVYGDYCPVSSVQHPASSKNFRQLVSAPLCSISSTQIRERLVQVVPTERDWEHDEILKWVPVTIRTLLP